MNSDGQSPHILVINDSREILALKREILEDEGFRVTTRITGEIHLDEIAHIEPSLVIFDYTSEIESNLLQHLTVDSSLSLIPIVLCTGAVREVTAIRPRLDAMGIAVVFKPFDIDHLVSVVRQRLGLASDREESLPPRLD